VMEARVLSRVALKAVQCSSQDLNPRPVDYMLITRSPTIS